MTKNNQKSRLVTFIGGFYIFGGFIVLLSLVFNGSSLKNVFDLPHVSDNLVKLIVGVLSIIFGYLYLKRYKIGYYSILFYSILFFLISTDLATKHRVQPYIGNVLYSIFVVIVSLLKRFEFTKNITRKVNDGDSN